MYKRSLIHRLGFDIVRGCQLRCVGCPNSTIRAKPQFITASDFKTCLLNIDVERINLIRLFIFGEPLLHPDVPSILTIVKESRIHIDIVEISTTAQYHNFPMLADIFKTQVLNHLIVSCDGEGTAEDYERLRPPANWGKLMKFLIVASNYRVKYAPFTKLFARIICETEMGRHKWMDILEPLGWTPRFRSWLPLPGSQLKPLNSIPPQKNGVCMYLKNYTLYVDCNGTVVPCCVHPKAGNLGNLINHKYSEILKGHERLKFIKRMQFDRGTMPICGRCAVKSSLFAIVENRLYGLTKVLPISLLR